MMCFDVRRRALRVGVGTGALETATAAFARIVSCRKAAASRFNKRLACGPVGFYFYIFLQQKKKQRQYCRPDGLAL